MISSSISPSPSGSGTVRSSSLHALPSHLPYPSETGALRALRYATRALRAIRNGGECKVNGQRQEPHEPTEVANGRNEGTWLTVGALFIHAVRPLLYSLRSLLAPYSRFAAYGVMGMVREWVRNPRDEPWDVAWRRNRGTEGVHLMVLLSSLRRSFIWSVPRSSVTSVPSRFTHPVGHAGRREAFHAA